MLVTGISPTPAGEGKTTTTVGLGDALNRIGSRAVICLREPSLGPSFGMKGGAAGGGYSQVVPMDQINLHFTGDFHAITSANNLLAAMIDNHIYWGNSLGIDARRVSWRRCLDMNDRALRTIVGSLGGVANGFPREDGFDITVASEVMAVFCLSRDLDDLQERLGRMIVAQKRDGTAVTAKDLKADGAMAVLLKDALAPNLVQTLEGSPAFVHGGPFANIAHGCNSVMATRLGLEAGRRGGDRGRLRRRPGRGEVHRHQVPLGRAEAVLRGGGGDGARAEDARRRGAQRAGHGERGRGAARRGEPGAACGEPGQVRAAGGGGREPLHLGHRGRVRRDPRRHGASRAWRRSPAPTGATAARAPRRWPARCSRRSRWARRSLRRCMPKAMPLAEKIRTIARQIYRAADILMTDAVARRLEGFEKAGFGHVPVCIAKTQYSFTSDPTVMGAPEGHILPVREVRLSAGAGFVVAICGDIMTMPGLPRVPSAEAIHLREDGEIEGLF